MKEKNNIIYKIKKNVKKKLKLFNIILNNNSFNNFNLITLNNNKLLNILNNNINLINCKYNLYGIYQYNTNLWIWATALQNSNQNLINKIEKIKSYYYLFEYNKSDIKNNNRYLFYYQLLTQDVIQITDETILEWIPELLIYLSDEIYCFNPINNEGNMQFITLKKVNEKYI